MSCGLDIHCPRHGVCGDEPGLSLPLLQWLPAYRREWLRPDVVAGVTTAAVVIPKSLAYATIAGLPIQVGLYTAFIPLIVYAMLGSSRPMSVTTTTTIAILTGAELAIVAPDGDPAMLLSACALLTLMVGAILVLASHLPTRLRRQFHLRARAGRIQGRHRRRDHHRSVAQDSRHPFRQGIAAAQPAGDRHGARAPVVGHRGRRRADDRDHRRHRKIPARLARAADRDRGGHRGRDLARPAGAWRRAGGRDSLGTAVVHDSGTGARRSRWQKSSGRRRSASRS